MLRRTQAVHTHLQGVQEKSGDRGPGEGERRGFACSADRMAAP